MKIQHNISAINSQRNITMTDHALAKNLERLSSGYKINRAGDDAAGLAISEGMRAQISITNQAKRNTLDGISLIQTVEGALTEVHSMLNRMKGMSVQVANGTYTDTHRATLDMEMQQLKDEIERIGTSTNFSGVPLFTNGGTSRKVSFTSTYGCTLDLANKTVSLNYASRAGEAPASNGYEALAEKIATEYVPNAVSQILDAFPSLKANIGADKVEMELKVEYIDGGYGTLAYAKASFHSNGRPFNMQLVVDTADFSDESIGSEVLQSTITHELMHSVMQYTLTDGMFGRNGAEKFPEWFTEGTAQLAGGGFATNWNTGLQQIANQLTGASDTSKDEAVKTYLKSYDVKSRPYGHGYLAAAYIGYLAYQKSGGTGGVTGQNIAAGMNNIYNELLNPASKSLYSVLSSHTNGVVHDQASLEALFDNPSGGLVDFVRRLSFASKGGAGSIVAGGLDKGGSDIIGTGTASSSFSVSKWSVGAAGRITFAVGNGDGNMISVDLFRLDDMGLRLSGTNLLTQEDTNQAIASVDSAIDMVSQMRSHYGAMQNRLEHTYANLSNTVENLTAAESRIRDTDMAYAITEHVRNQILMQSGQTMLVQANQVPNSILSLLG